MWFDYSHTKTSEIIRRWIRGEGETEVVESFEKTPIYGKNPWAPKQNSSFIRFFTTRH